MRVSKVAPVFDRRWRQSKTGATILLFAALAVTALRAGDTLPDSPKAIQQELKSFATLGSVLYVAAHPDDEDTALITYLARGRGYRTAYLSVTRGDGGQNELGPEFGEKLGLARTYELLAARHLDGGRQFFTRALDFGFTKDVNETLRIWDHQQVLGDVVRVIRKFRPDVVIAGMNPVQTPGQHGQHVASAQLAIEAFKISGDPKAFPEQLADGLTPWQPKRILQNLRFAGRGASNQPLVTIETGGEDPVTGESFAAIAARSRAMHKTQGFGNFNAAALGGGGSRPASFGFIAGEPAKTDLMDGLDLTFARFPGGDEVAKLADDAIAQFKTDDPSASVPALLAIRAKLSLLSLPTDPVVADKRAQLDRILQACLGLSVETTVPNAEVVPGEKIKAHLSVTVRSSVVPVKWTSTTTLASTVEFNTPRILQSEKTETVDREETLQSHTSISQPYWLREESSAGMFRVAKTNLIGLPLNPPTFPVAYGFEIGGQRVTIFDEPVQLVAGASEAQKRRPLTAIPPVSLAFPFEVKLIAPGDVKNVTVEVTAARPRVTGTLRLEAPAGWKISPATRDFALATAGEKKSFSFTVTAPEQAASATFTVNAEVGGARFNTARVVFSYPHIPVQLLQPPARLKVASFALATRGKNLGYLAGAGDSVTECLAEMGYHVTQLAGADLTPEKLKNLDAVVIGVRAFNERKDLAPNLPGLFAWVEAGGTVIAQYNRPSNALRDVPLGPFPLSIDGPAPQLRVTDETAPVTFLAPDHPALNVPNKITSADFDGWVQERGAYFPATWDARYTPLLAMSDPGEKQPDSSLLVARSGKGYFAYTSLSFFRQLPAGVPGAYRLFANLVSLGK